MREIEVIKKVRIQNFKCLRDIEVELGPFNVVIGLNDSGKSSFIQALQRLKPAEKVQVSLADVWQKDPDLSIKLTANGVAGSEFEYFLELLPSGGVYPQRLQFGGNLVYEIAKSNNTVVMSNQRVGTARPKTNILSNLHGEGEGVKVFFQG